MRKTLANNVRILCFFILPVFIPAQSPASEGKIDVKDFSGTGQWSLNLDGEWEFYWNEFLGPSDFQSGTTPRPEYISIPGNWNSVNSYPSHGYATLRLVISGLEDNQTYSIDIPEMLTSFRFFLNGKEVYDNGMTGEDRGSSVPRFRPGLVSFQSSGGSAEIVCQISNFDHRNSGIWRSVKLGTEQKVSGAKRNKLLLELFISSVLLTISLFHLGVFIYRNKATAELLFGLSCLILFFRTVSTGEQLINQLFPLFPWGLARRMEYSPFFAVAPLFMAFISVLFPDEASKKINRVFYGIYIAMGAFFILFPVRISNNAILLAELMLLIAMGYTLSILFRALAKKRDHSFPIIMAFIILALTSINDILFSRQIINTSYMAPLGFILFIIIQSQMLTRRYASSFNEVTSLTHQLKELNESLSRFVPFQFLNYLKKKSILDVNLGDQVLEDMTILFADIRSFTSLSEVMTPEENFRFLNSFLSQVVPVIRQQGGFVDKFIGDAIMALFPFPPDQAVRAAIELQRAVIRYNAARNRAGYQPISLGVGIHTGQLMLGTIGETNRMETTVIADTVNIASRLEELTKTYGARIIISKDLFDKMEDKSGILSRSLGASAVKGKAAPLEIVEILDDENNGPDIRKVENLSNFEKAVDLIKEREYGKAAVILEQVTLSDPDDRAAAFFLSHCREAGGNG
ncbi:adenylate/guanylate cyclase domain-containing protein [Spirochaeta isovalerica]|uniref:Class 3 adenylate cyclase n=1 Tax=Spirochaeta isovalerica TaxID=150 RepID=A0A841RA20_9SPIO|nr:adenylate/guanylate cyclase domain-containing protein [Spirochaeta isovalerica]MBB6480596.1 class 3 adenylate cyclase [Spirochaeta isovalerica]